MPVYPGAPPHFFPPRLEVVVEEQDANGLPSHTRNQPSFDGFLRYQPHRPTGAAFGRIAAHHGNNPLLLTVIKHSGGAGTPPFE
jgi:lipoprotein signal peptidase